MLDFSMFLLGKQALVAAYSLIFTPITPIFIYIIFVCFSKMSLVDIKKEAEKK